MAETLKAFDTQMNDLLETYVRKPTLIKGVVHLLLILYAAKLAPQLPASVLKIFDNSYFKLFVFSLILWTAQFSPSTAILIAIAFLVSTNYLSNKPLFEFLENTNMAMDSAMQNIQPVMGDNKVHYIQNEDTTMVIQPKIIPHESGQIVLNPSVVISPVIVTLPDGKTATVTPKVTTITTGSSTDSNVVPNNSSPDHVHDSPVADSERKSVNMNEVKPLNTGDMNHLKMSEIPVEVGKDAKVGIETSCFVPRSFDLNKVVSYDVEQEFGTFTSSN